MTEFAIVKTGASIAAVGGAVAALAVIDPSVTSIALAAIAAAVVIIPLWFKFKTDSLNAKLKEHDEQIKEVSNGVKAALIVATGKAERAEGVLEGVSLAKTEAAIVSAATAAGEAKADAKNTA